MKTILATVAILSWLACAQATEPFRTDINPALTYYQSLLYPKEISDADHDYLFKREWRGRPLEPKFGELLAQYDSMFKLMRQARSSEAPCDWGIDLTDGPDAVLPGLAPVKSAAQTARLRVMWHLQNGRQTEARDDLLAAFALGRNVARDGILISTLVQIAVENILAAVVAENFGQFTPETLGQIIEGIDACPPRHSIAQTVAAEKIAFHDWLLRKIREAQAEHANDHAKALAAIHRIVARMGGEGGDASLADKIIQTAGGTADGVVRLIRELEPLYDRVEELLKLPKREFEPQFARFNQEIQSHANPIVPALFGIFEKCRNKEFAADVTLAMLRAAVAFKSQGEAGLKGVPDPCGDGPFEYRRFIFEGVDRGFLLKSPFQGRGFDEMLIFVEKDGPPFQVIGLRAGQAPASR